MNSPSSPALPRLLSRNELPQDAITNRDAPPQYKRSLPPKIGGRLLKRKESRLYPPGDSAGVSAVPAGDSNVPAAGASVAAGLVSVVAGAVVGAGVAAGVTVSVFCSQAAISAAPARMQMYFFIVGDAYCFNRSIAASVVFGPRRMSFEKQIARGQH
jgi:hypothetical protein